MTTIRVQFSDATQSKIIAEFGGPQSAADYPHQGAVGDDDPRLLAFRGQDANATIRAKIVALEAQQTPRRLREAVLTAEGAAWLTQLQGQIAALRSQLS